MYQNRDKDDSRTVELRNLVAEVCSDLERALRMQCLSEEERGIVSGIADKMDAVADLIRN